jgi:NADH-quinone oxidoreductase subunit M
VGHLARAALHFAVDGVTIPSHCSPRPRRRGRGPRPRTRAGRPAAPWGRAAATRPRPTTRASCSSSSVLSPPSSLATTSSVAFEVVLVPMWVLISRFGDDHATERARADASNRFVLFTALVDADAARHPRPRRPERYPTSACWPPRTAPGCPPRPRCSSRPSSSSASASRCPWPVHTWLPPAHTIAPTAGSVLLAAVLLKMGPTASSGWPSPPCPRASTWWRRSSRRAARSGSSGEAWPLVERDQRLVAYSSVAHMGFVALGLASGTQTGMQAALFGNVAHGSSRRCCSSSSAGSRSAGECRPPSPATPCATCPRGWGSPSWWVRLGAVRRGWSGSGRVPTVYAAWTPAGPRPAVPTCAAGVVGCHRPRPTRSACSASSGGPPELTGRSARLHAAPP